ERGARAACCGRGAGWRGGAAAAAAPARSRARVGRRAGGVAGAMAGSPADPANARARQEEPRHLVVGHISKAHGTRGEVFVWPLTDDPERVFAVGEEVQVAEPDEGAEPDEEWQPLAVERRRPFKRGMLVKFEGLDDRTAVEPLAGRYILMPLEKLAPLEEGEVYYHQLLGAEVVTVEGQVVGRVREVFETEPAH